ncbi:ATP-dependent Clp protease adapter protein ClpS-like [Procambarus clarkii]|uniref:ATP-dependent Clp protease adapter protein ClpS-like n=1 Tax=Procambarus clarkii TaxID=6728 RepID=UPI0037448FAD
MADTAAKTKSVIKTKITEPGKYAVVLHNDDKTPMDFVVSMLVNIFNHDESNAFELMMKVHNHGSAVAGVYHNEVAEQKCSDGLAMAKHYKYPLSLSVEPV